MLRGIDPITFEIIRHKLYRVVDEAIIALENVSGSPITNEGHDMMVSLYGPDGELLIGGVGFLHHLTSAAQAVKHIIENFSEDPGIFEDDVFFLNDSYTAALHPPDVYMISPIHWNGKLTGFVANFVHVTDIGAIDPGGFCPNATECYQEGFVSKGIKIVEKGKIRKDVLETILNVVRDPGMTALDFRSQLAANHVAKERMQRLYQDYGFEIVETVGKILIEQSEQLLRQRLSEMPDGVWKARQYIDMPNQIYQVELTATKQGDTLTYDFTGTSKQASLGINCCYWATLGGMFAPIFPLLAYDITWNEGVTRPINLIAPEGTIVNCQRPAPISIATVGAIQIVNNLSTTVISKMMGASPKYKERATAVWHGSHAHVELHGLNQTGEYFISPLTDTFAGAGGARAFKDGVDIGGEIPNVVSRWGNVETHEMNLPILYLFRRPVTDSGGPGKFRGGVCHEFAIMPHDSFDGKLGTGLCGKGLKSPMSHGIFGGYPGSNVDLLIFRESNGNELPPEFFSMKGEKQNAQWGIFDLEKNDALYVRFMGGGGYGDPLKRDVNLVLEDILQGMVSVTAAKDVFGVVFDDKKQVVNIEATLKQRDDLRKSRLGGKNVVVECREKVAVSGFPINESLQIIKEKEKSYIQCTHCGNKLADATNSWKDKVISRKSPLSQAGPRRSVNNSFFLREYFCPGCAALLDTEVVGFPMAFQTLKESVYETPVYLESTGSRNGSFYTLAFPQLKSPFSNKKHFNKTDET